MSEKVSGVFASSLEDEREEAERLRDPSPEMLKPLFASPDDIVVTAATAAGRVSVVAVNRAIREAVPGCKVTIGTASGTTDANGTVQIDVSGLNDGEYVLSVVAPDVSDETVGPGFPSDPSKRRVWRPFAGTVEVSGGAIAKAVPESWTKLDGRRLEVRLQPLWMLPRTPSRQRSEDVDLIIIHHTAGGLGGDCNEFLYNPKKGVHYLIAPNGEVYKFVSEDLVASHAGYSYWQGTEGVNGRSIGIELSHTSGPYPGEQISSLIELLKRLVKAFPAIPAERVVGHSDVGITEPRDRPPKAVGRKSTDPGSTFPWERVEALGLGLLVHQGDVAQDIYGGFFKHAPQGKLSHGDNDDTHRYGGQILPGLSGVVTELQQDLAKIGYLCDPVDGAYGTVTLRAVQMFQQHIFSGSRRRGTAPSDGGDGNLDRDTAVTIKRVLGQTVPTQGV